MANRVQSRGIEETIADRFDQIADAYMVVAGVPEPASDHADRATKYASYGESPTL